MFCVAVSSSSHHCPAIVQLWLLQNLQSGLCDQDRDWTVHVLLWLTAHMVPHGFYTAGQVHQLTYSVCIMLFVAVTFNLIFAVLNAFT